MPTSSRMSQLLGHSSPLRRNTAVLPRHSGMSGWPDLVGNGLVGGHIRAAADPAHARVRVDLYWPHITQAVIERVHADGTAHAVRGGDPAIMCTAWARWDYECPLDAEVTYRAAPVDAGDATATTGPVTLNSSGRHWLKSVAKPHLNAQVTIFDKGSRQQPARSGRLDPPLRPDPIFVYQVRATDKGAVALYAADQAAETAVRALLADGRPLLLQHPGTAGGESLYLMVDTAGYDPVSRLTVDLQRVIGLPFDTIARPPGPALAGPGDSYGDVADRYPTYNHVAASGLTNLELSMLE